MTITKTSRSEQIGFKHTDFECLCTNPVHGGKLFKCLDRAVCNRFLERELDIVPVYADQHTKLQIRLNPDRLIKCTLPIMYDIYIYGEWFGSRRTIEQCYSFAMPIRDLKIKEKYRAAHV